MTRGTRTRVAAGIARLPRIVQFAAAGAVGTVVRVAILTACVEVLGLSHQVGYIVAVVLTIALLWVLNRRIAWQDAHASRTWFVIARLSTEVIGLGLFTVLSGRRFDLPGGREFRVGYQAANLACIAVGTAINYVACRGLVFRDPSTVDHVRLKRAALLLPLVPVAVLGGRPLVMTLWATLCGLMLLVAILTALRMQYAWQRPERVDHVDLDDLHEPWLPFSIIVPVRDEPVVARTLERVLASNYPEHLLEVLVVVSDDEVDDETRAIVERIAAEHANVRTLAPPGEQRSKPLSLEAARGHCTGEVVGILDAESLVSVDLLAYVNTLASRHPEAGVFQGGVQLMNIHAPGRQRRAGRARDRFLGWANEDTSWWRTRNCLEYYVWFMSRLRYQAQARFIPLGGNTVFVRRRLLDLLGGWDTGCLTEDAELGVRASVAGVTTMVFYHPQLTTQEETPESLSKLVVQRTRWMMGFLQVFRKGEWRRLRGVRPRLLAAEMLLMPLFQAFSGVMLPLSAVLALALRVPVGFVIWSWLPLGMGLVTVTAEQAAFREFADAYGLRVRRRDSVRLVVSSPLYQLVLSVAAVRATVRLVRRQLEWEKTSHAGAHLGAIPQQREPRRNAVPAGIAR